MIFTFAVRIQPVGKVYVIADMPADTPVTTPELLMEATDVVPELHMPPADELLRVVVAFTHAFSAPLMALGKGLTTTATLERHPVGKV